MSYNKTKTDPELGSKVHEHLVKMGVETPTFKTALDRKDKIDLIEKDFAHIMQVLGLDLDDDSLTETPKRVAKMYVNEVFNGRYTEQPNLTRFPNITHLNELMIIGPIAVKSACSHHLCPIMGRVWIGVLPDKQTALIGLSKYARITEWIMCRPQIQEEAVVELANILEEKMKPTGLALVMEADHFCMQWRGVKDLNSKMVNSVMRGSFLKDANLRREFLALMDKQQGKQ